MMKISSEEHLIYALQWKPRDSSSSTGPERHNATTTFSMIENKRFQDKNDEFVNAIWHDRCPQVANIAKEEKDHTRGLHLFCHMLH